MVFINIESFFFAGVADPDVVRNMFTCKNPQIDLVEGGQYLPVDLLGETSIFSPTVVA